MVTLICMVGNDYRRIVDGVDYWRDRESIEALYLFFDHKKDKYGFASQINTEELSVSLVHDAVKPKAVGLDPQSFGDVFCTFYSILTIEAEKYKRQILVDATSTTKEAYGATITVALMFNNVRVYIVPPNERGWYVPSPNDKSFKEWFSKTRSIGGLSPQEIYLPGQRLKQPDKNELTILRKLHEHQDYSNTVTSIIRWCKADSEDPVVKNRFSRNIRRLEEKGLVEKRVTGQGKEVRLTNFGKIISEANKRSRALQQDSKRQKTRLPLKKGKSKK